MRTAGICLLLAALTLPACSLPPAASPRPASDEVLAFETTSARGSAFDVLRRHRPAWLSTRGGAAGLSGQGDLVVYVDGTREPRGLAALRSIDGTAVATVERLSAAEAHLKFGPGHTNGALIVTLGQLPGLWTR